MKRIETILFIIALAGSVGAQQAGAQGMTQGQTGAGSMMSSGESPTGEMGGKGMMGAADGTLAEGEIRKVDVEAKKLTIRHGAIPNMDMPPMTMVYPVKDPAMLDQVKAGDKVKFGMEKVGGAYVVTRIERP